MLFSHVICISGSIENGNFYKNFMRDFSALLGATKENEEITIVINSHGGDTEIALGIYDILNTCPRTIIGIVVGTAQSAASLILQGCRKRYMTPHSTLMLHRSHIHISGSAENAQASLDIFKQQDEHFYAIYANKTGQNVEEIHEIARRDIHFAAKEAVEIGLADEILVRWEAVSSVPDLSIIALELSPRATNCLESAHIFTLRQLLEKTQEDLDKIRSLGKTSLREIQHKLTDLGYTLKKDLKIPAQ